MSVFKNVLFVSTIISVFLIGCGKESTGKTPSISVHPSEIFVGIADDSQEFDITSNCDWKILHIDQTKFSCDKVAGHGNSKITVRPIRENNTGTYNGELSIMPTEAGNDLAQYSKRIPLTIEYGNSENKSSEKEILSFTLNDQSALINNTTITLSLPEGTDLTSLAPAITISPYATISPRSGVSMDFTNPVAYEVIAEDGSSVNYTVTITHKNVEKPEGPSYMDWLKISAEITYEEDGSTEYSKNIYEYDQLGRLTGTASYVNDKLFRQTRDYVYNGKECVYYYDQINYLTGEVTNSIKHEIVYYDDIFYKEKESIQYNDDEVSEYFKRLTSYDKQGRETGQTNYYNGVLGYQNRDYAYNGKTVVYYYENFAQTGTYSYKYRETYLDDKFYILSNRITYEEDEVNELYNYSYEYDDKGREIGFTWYNKGNLYQRYRDYSYDAKECTYYQDAYNNEGNITSTRKHKKIYY